jgi:tetratricopeptide (TPR) repeat protein
MSYDSLAAILPGERGDSLDRRIEAIATTSRNAESWRREGRFRPIAILLAIFFLLTVAGGLDYIFYQQRQSATKQTEIAEKNFSIALTSTGLLVQQVQNDLNTGVISVAAAKDLLTIAEGTLGQLGQSPQIIVVGVKLLLNLSDASSTSGDIPQALRHAESARTLAAHLKDTSASNHYWHFIYESSFRIGDAVVDQNNVTRGISEYHVAEGALQQLLAKESNNADWQLDLSFIYKKIGDALRQNDEVSALEQYRKALTISEKHASSRPDDPDSQRNLASNHIRIGQSLVAVAQGDLDLEGALVEIRAALAILTELVQKDKNNDISQSNLAYSHHVMGDVLQRRDKSVEALKEYQAARDIRELLAEKDSRNTTWQDLLALEYGSIGDALKARGDTSGALELYSKESAIRQVLATKDPSNVVWQRKLAAARKRFADMTVVPH